MTTYTESRSFFVAKNPTFSNGDLCTERDTGLTKTMDGSTAWASLNYTGGSFSHAVLSGYNPVFASGQVITETGTNFTKTGDGSTAFNSLNWNQGGGAIPKVLSQTLLQGFSALSGTGLPVYTGTATLSAGSVTVSNAAVTANTIIRLSQKTKGGTTGALYISAKTAGTSFVISSTNASDTSVVFYEILAW